MTSAENNVLDIDGRRIEMPIRIKKFLELDDIIVTALGYDYDKDIKIEWNKGGKEKWSDLNRSFHNSSIIAVNHNGEIIWTFSRRGFYNIAIFDTSEMRSDMRLSRWREENPDKDVFLAYGEKVMVVESRSGKILSEFEQR